MYQQINNQNDLNQINAPPGAPQQGQTPMQQQSYQQQSPMQQGQFIQGTTLPGHAHERELPTQILCGSCRTQGITIVKKNTVNVVTGIWFIATCLFCCFIPGCCENQTEIKHYCPHCSAYVGKKDASCC